MDKNTQELLQKGEALPVMEAFYTIQGEGFHKGKASYFIRIGGCDVGCHWCDVKESWDYQSHTIKDIDEIIFEAVKYSKLVVITGGEPLCHNLEILTYGIRKLGKKIHLETSGTEPLTGEFDWICLSPKKFKKPLEKYLSISDELKIIIFNSSDFRWAEKYANKMNKNSELILQPEWSVEKKMNPLILDYIKKNPKWKISLQIHKYLNVD